jgi:Anti-sigma-K factor rskA
MHSERHEELLALRAAGVRLEGEDALEYERLLAEPCADCAELLPELRFAATALGELAPARLPPPALKKKVLDSLGPSRLPRPSGFAPWAFAAAAALLFVIIALDDARLRRQREELTAQSAQLAQRLDEQRPDARAKVFWSEKAKRGIVVAGNLETLPPDRQYQLWVFANGKPVDAGVFDADASGRALFESKDLAAISTAENFAVTVEPRGGVPQPTGPIVLLGTPS